MEKNVDAVKKMFRFTEQEARYCLFRFITAAWTQPRQYFEFHLRCNVYSGRPYLKPEGNLLFYTRILAPLPSEPLTEGEKLRLAQISPLAPGDFRIVRDRLSLSPSGTVTHDGMLKALEEEAKIKKLHNREKEIGFKYG